MKEWQFNILFFVGVGGALVLLLGPEFGLEIGQNPTAVTGVGAILTYVLTQRKTLTNREKSKKNPTNNEEAEDDGS